MMIKRKLILILGAAGFMAFSSTLLGAQSDATEEKAERQARLEIEYNQALAAADRSKAQADASMEKAREQLHLVEEQRGKSLKMAAESRDRQQAEMESMREELNRAHRQLRESTRAIAQVNRDLARTRLTTSSNAFVFSTSDRPILGVILGNSSDIGITVLGVSPDGPAERAGIKAGDEIIAVGGRVLSAVDDSGDVRNGLNIALRDLKADEAVIVSVERGTDTLDLSVVPEIRTPVSWQSVIRFPSASVAPVVSDGTVIVERIMVPEIDTEALTEKIEQMRIEIDARRVIVKAHADTPASGHYAFRFEDMSEMGDFALHDTNAWFGMPLASGLRLAEIEPALGEYFKTDRGVLVLKAKTDNALLLQAGDVILNVHGTDVDSPSDFMRALRDYEPGDELVIDIKRNRKSKTLKPVIDENQTRFFIPKSDGLHQITIIAGSN